jgi:TolB-like protein
MGFWAELRRRNVVRVAAAYLVVAWIVMQVVNVATPALDLPGWFDGAVFVLLAVGFAVAIVMSWVFELSAEGLKRTAPLEAGAPPAPPFTLADSALIVALVAVLGVSLFQVARPQAAPVPALEVAAPLASLDDPRPSIAVLPFADMSPDGDQEYFSDGLSEELLNQLAQIQDLRVIARTSSFAFKGRNTDMREIGQTLGVAHLLEGSVRKSDDRLRITAQLIRASDGSHLWSQTFERRLDDVFAIQDEIAFSVADRLSIALGVGENTRQRGGTQNVAAYELVLRARDQMARTGEEQRGSVGAALYRSALALDPDYAQAWVGLANALRIWAVYETSRVDELLSESEEAADRALAIEPELADAHLARGGSAEFRLDWASATQSYARLRDLAAPEYRSCDPTKIAPLGHKDAPVACARLRRESDPLSLLATQFFQRALTVSGGLAEAEAEYERSLAMPGDREQIEHLALLREWENPDSTRIEARMRRYLEHNTVTMPVFHAVMDVRDDPDAALALLRAAAEDPAYSNGPRLALVALWLGHYGDPEGALRIMRTWTPTQRGAIDLMWFPSLAEMRRLPGFKDIVRDLGFVDYWRATGEWGDFCRPLGPEDFECE